MRKYPAHGPLSCLIAAGCALFSLLAAPAQAQKVVVSLTFDDAIDDAATDDVPAVAADNVFDAARLHLSDEDTTPLETLCPNVGDLGDAPLADEQVDCDVPATFYLNFPRLNEKAYLSIAQVQDMEAWGHEIGGHSAHHLEIPKLESASPLVADFTEQKLQVCWDRRRLSLIPKRDLPSSSLLITSFAYPFGEYTWAGDPAANARFGAPSPLLTGEETRDLMGRNYPGDCAYRSARAVGVGVANTPECIDMDSGTPCVWAETIKPLDVFALRAPSSIHDLTPLDYPVVPINDDGNGIYDRDVEFESRADTIKGWIDNTIAHPPATGKSWLLLTFHSICFNHRCNDIGMEYHQFSELVSWLRQKRKSGEIDIKTVSQALAHTKELKVTVPPLAPLNTAVKNPAQVADINNDFTPDCFDSGGMGVYRNGELIFNAPHANADNDGNGIADDGQTGDAWYAWQVMAGGATRGRYIVRIDLGQCALAVKAGNQYRMRFYYRRPAAGRTCGFMSQPDQLPCPIPYAPSAPEGAPPVYSLIYATRRPAGWTKIESEDAMWSTFTKTTLPEPGPAWQLAEAVMTVPAGVNALSFGLEILHEEASGLVEVDVDSFSYCQVSGDANDPVGICPD